MIDRLIEILGEKNVTDSPQELENYSVTGKIPALLLFPASSDQIAKIMKLAKREGKKVLIAGRNSQCYFGATSEAFDWCVSLNRMTNIIEYESADLTVTVESGVTLRQLQKFLNNHKQFLPLDPIGANKRTLGGIVSTNSSGPFRLLYGTCRDLVLGMKVALADGTIIRAGGKTVKNVAGYDLSKLFIGAMGTLGVITQITFKLFPLPAQSQTLCSEFKRFDDIPELIKSVGSSNLAISRCEYFNSTFVEKCLNKLFQPKEPHFLLFNVQGQPESVYAAIEKLQQMVLDRGGKNMQDFSHKDDAKLWNQISSLNATYDKLQFDFHCQVSTPKGLFGAVMNDIQKYSLENDQLFAIQAHAGNGMINIFWGDAKQENIKPDHFRSAIESLRQIARSCKGIMVVHSNSDFRNVEATVCSEVTVTSSSLDEPDIIWGKPASHFHLMKMIKARFDPHKVLASGRFIGGL